MRIKNVEAFYLDDYRNELNLVTDTERIGEYCLYWTYDPDPDTKDKTFLLSAREKRLEFDFEYDKHRRSYFIIEFKERQEECLPLLFGHRILPVTGTYNLRDIGGYLTESGRRIKWGAGYRSDYFALLKDDRMDYLNSLGIKTIIDFRGEPEAKESPNRAIGEGVNTYLCDPNAQIAAAAGALDNNEGLSAGDAIVAQARLETAQDLKAGDKKMIQQQINFVDLPDCRAAFGKTLKLLADPDNAPVVQHCRGGKDRTGFALMLLLGILGVPRDLIIYDYMLTKRARAQKSARYYERFMKLSQDKKIADYLFSFFDTKEEYIIASMDKIVVEYGSIRRYAQEVLGIGDGQIACLERLFLGD